MLKICCGEMLAEVEIVGGIGGGVVAEETGEVGGEA